MHLCKSLFNSCLGVVRISGPCDNGVYCAGSMKVKWGHLAEVAGSDDLKILACLLAVYVAFEFL